MTLPQTPDISLARQVLAPSSPHIATHTHPPNVKGLPTQTTKLASDVLADEVRESHDAPQEMSAGQATRDKVIVPLFILANAQWGIEYRLVMN